MSNINISGNLYTKASGAGSITDPYIQEVINKPFGLAVAMGKVENIAAVASMVLVS